jgi:hypothetical protein
VTKIGEIRRTATDASEDSNLSGFRRYQCNPTRIHRIIRPSLADTITFKIRRRVVMTSLLLLGQSQGGLNLRPPAIFPELYHALPDISSSLRFNLSFYRSIVEGRGERSFAWGVR